MGTNITVAHYAPDFMVKKKFKKRKGFSSGTDANVFKE